MSELAEFIRQAIASAHGVPMPVGAITSFAWMIVPEPIKKTWIATIRESFPLLDACLSCPPITYISADWEKEAKASCRPEPHRPPWWKLYGLAGFSSENINGPVADMVDKWIPQTFGEKLEDVVVNGDGCRKPFGLVSRGRSPMDTEVYCLELGELTARWAPGECSLRFTWEVRGDVIPHFSDFRE